MRICCALAIMAGWLAYVHGDTRYVVPPGTPGVMPAEPYNTGWAQAATNILAAIGEALDGDTILLSNGVYALTNQIALNADLKLQGFGGSREAVVLNGGKAVRCLSITHPAAEVSGITVSNGYAVGDGAGIYMTNGLVTNCLICNNVASNGSGGGVCLNGGGLLADCEVRGNRVLYVSGYNGGGGARVTGNGLITNCVIAGNSAYSEYGGGGGVSLQAGGVLRDSLVVSNTAQGATAVAPGGGRGGGISCQDIPNPLVINSRILDNVASNGGGIFALNGGVFSNCVISGNSALGTGAGSGVRGAGGGIEMGGGTTDGREFYACIISNNYAAAEGGGVFNNSTMGGKYYLFRDCVVINNRAKAGGGMFLNSTTASGRVEQSAVKGNLAFNTGSSSANGTGGINIQCKQGYILGCEISGNIASNAYAGGIFSDLAEYLLVADCVISNNTTMWRGGGICLYEKYSAVISNCVIVDNTITSIFSWPNGGGLYLGPGTGMVCNCLIAGNASAPEALGGGIYASGADTHAIVNCTIAGNQAKNGGGVSSVGTNTLVNCMVYSNTALSGIASNHDVALSGDGSKAEVLYCCLSATNGLDVAMSLTNAPVFIAPETGNYRLSPVSAGINAGSNQTWMGGATDLDGRRRIDWLGRRVDIGCYEYQHAGNLFTFR